MSTYEKLEDSVVTSLDTILQMWEQSCQVIVANQNGPEPTKDYVAVSVLDMSKQGRASKSGMADFVNGNAVEQAAQAYETLVQLDFFGKNSSELAMVVHGQFMSNTAFREVFLRNALAPRGVSSLRRSPQLRDNKWINSYSFDMRLGWTLLTKQQVDWVDSIVVAGKTIPLI